MEQLPDSIKHYIIGACAGIEDEEDKTAKAKEIAETIALIFKKAFIDAFKDYGEAWFDSETVEAYWDDVMSKIERN